MIPRSIREALQIKDGTSVLVFGENDTIILKKIGSDPSTNLKSTFATAMEKNRERSVTRKAAEFTRSARLYDKIVTPFTSRIARTLIRVGQVGQGLRVLDVGTGPGVAAFLAARRVGDRGNVLGIDVSEGMLSVAKRKAAALETKNLAFEQMDAFHLKLPDESFDRVLCNTFTPQPRSDIPIAFREIYRVLRPGGLFALSEFDRMSPIWATAWSLLSEQAHLGINPQPDVSLPARIESFLALAKFSRVTRVTRNFVSRFPTVSYLEFFILRALPEYYSMPDPARRKFRHDALNALGEFAGNDGLLSEKRVVHFWTGRRRATANSYQD